MSAKKMSEEFAVDQIEDMDTSPADEQANEAAPATTPTTKSQPAAKASKALNQPFDPTQYLSNFDGRDYLEVKWRLLWLRSQHPDARITTEIVQHNEEGGFALFRAEVEVPTGGKATGWGSETVRDFHDYIEAAETKAIGRALAALGYGTQFCTDFDFSANARPGGRAQVVDAPVNLAEPRNVVNRASSFTRNSGGANGNRASASGSGFGGGNSTTRPAVHSAGSGGGGRRMPAEEDDFDQLPAAGLPSGSGATEKQIKAIYAIGRASKR